MLNDEILDSKMANALFANARMSEKAGKSLQKWGAQVGEATGIGVDVAQSLATTRRVLEAYSAKYGGLWVGGKATLSRAMLSFEPNAVNRFIHENGAFLTLALPLEAIESVTIRPGFLTDIVDVSTDGGVFSLRCFKVKTFARKINDARGVD